MGLCASVPHRHENRPHAEFPLVSTKGLNSISSFFIFGELMIKIVLGFARVRLFQGAVMVGAKEKPHENLR